MSDTRALHEQVDALVRRAQAGEEAARDELIRRCYDRIYRWALMRTGDPDDADDVTQTVLVRLHTHLHRYAGRSRFTTWLFRVTQNAANAIHRRRSAILRLGERLQQHQVPEAATGDPIEQLHAGALADAVRTLFRELSPIQRQIVDLADLQGVPQAEIAEMLEMNPATVRAHLFRARRTLRVRMLAQYPSLLEEQKA